MHRKLPPLNAVKAFEAAARLKSLSKAACELQVTPAAVSQQIKSLESYLNTPLFERSRRNLQLSAWGKAYLPLISEGMERFYTATKHLTQLNTPHQLTVSAPPSIATKWLGPRLLTWFEENPEVNIRVIASHSEVNFIDEDIDFRISYGHATFNGLERKTLFTDEVFPVGSSALMNDNPVKRPEDLANHTLIHVNWGTEFRSLPSWDDWIKAANLENIRICNGPEFNLSSLAIQAAIDGQGLMLGQGVMVADDLVAGRLIRLFDLSLPLSEPYSILFTESVSRKPHAEHFLSWLLGL